MKALVCHTLTGPQDLKVETAWPEPVAAAGQVLVDCVVHGFPHQVVQRRAVMDVADVHAGPLADGLQAFENEQVAGVIRRHEGFRISAHTD